MIERISHVTVSGEPSLIKTKFLVTFFVFDNA